MLLKKSVISVPTILFILLAVCSGIGTTGKESTPLTLQPVWVDLNNNEVDLSKMAKDKGGIYILVLRAMGCASCNEKDINEAKRLYPDVIVVIGYVKEDELHFFKNKSWGITILRDEKYTLVQGLRMRQTSVLLEVDKNLSIIKKAGLKSHFELKSEKPPSSCL